LFDSARALLDLNLFYSIIAVTQSNIIIIIIISIATDLIKRWEETKARARKHI